MGFGQALEGRLSFFLNLTNNVHDLSNITDQAVNLIAWAPSRQHMRSLSIDLNLYESMVRGADQASEFARYNSSMQAYLELQGPIIGFQSVSAWLIPSTTAVGDGRDIRCYWNIDLSTLQKNSSTGGFCFRTGNHWSNTRYSEAFFNVGQAAANGTATSLSASIYSADQIVRVSTTCPCRCSYLV